MQHFWSVFGLFSERSRGTPAGFPRPPGGSPSPSKSPPEGGDPAPRGAGACRPPVSPSGSPSTPRGTPTGFPRLRRLPLPSGLAAKGASEARRALARRGVGKKSKLRRRLRPPGRQRWKCGEGRVAGGQGWGQPVGSPRAVHGVSLLLSTGREAPAGRVAISTSPPPGGPTRPPLGACSAPQGSRLPFKKSSEYTCLSSTLACQVARRRRGFDKNRPDFCKNAQFLKKPPESSQ